MAAFHALIRFESTDDNKVYFADLGTTSKDLPGTGSQIDGYESVDDLLVSKGGKPVTVGKVAPKPWRRADEFCTLTCEIIRSLRRCLELGFRSTASA